MVLLGWKSYLIGKLDKITDAVTETKRPHSVLLGGTAIPPRGWLVKRENSDGAHHVIFPKNAKSLVSIKKGGSYQWITQEMMPLL